MPLPSDVFDSSVRACQVSMYAVAAVLLVAKPYMASTALLQHALHTHKLTPTLNYSTQASNTSTLIILHYEPAPIHYM